MKETKNTTETQNVGAQQPSNTAIVNQQQEIPKNMKRKFEVEIYDKVLNEATNQIRLEKVKYDKPVIIEAADKKELQDFADRLELCQQTFKIVRVLDDTPNQSMQQPQSQPQPQSQTQESVLIPRQPNASQLEPIMQKHPPKFYKVGDVEIKNDNGKIYQKQWLKLSESEMANLRIINDKNNSIFSLNGRHIEMKKWVLVDSDDSETTDLEQNI